MFPSNQYKETITLFTPYTDTDSGDIRYFRRVLRRAEWKREAGTVQRDGGTATNNQIEINIPLIHNGGEGQYISFEKWALTPVDELGGVWTLYVGGELERTLILKGEHDAPLLEQWQPANDIGLHVRSFREEHGELSIRSPVNVDEIMYGPASMRRVSCRC